MNVEHQFHHSFIHNIASPLITFHRKANIDSIIHFFHLSNIDVCLYIRFANERTNERIMLIVSLVFMFMAGGLPQSQIKWNLLCLE